MTVPIKTKNIIAENTLKLTLDISHTNFRFRPGQYLRLGLPSLADRPITDQFHAFSIASSSRNHQTLRLIFRLSDSIFKQTINTLQPGNEVIIEGPLGIFTLPHHIKQPIVMLAGGIGVAPFLSILHTLRGRPSHTVTLYYFNVSKETAACLY